jgi:hypothetical protein
MRDGVSCPAFLKSKEERIEVIREMTRYEESNECIFATTYKRAFAW